MTIKQQISKNMREQMRFWATGVAIVTTKFEASMHGMTVNSFTSISLDPPRVLISIDKETRTHHLIEQSNSFTVTLLSADQKEISERFAGDFEENKDRFDGIDTSISPLGNQILLGGLAYFDCNSFDSFDAGSHTVFIADVIQSGILDSMESDQIPLIYFNRGYHQIKE